MWRAQYFPPTDWQDKSSDIIFPSGFQLSESSPCPHKSSILVHVRQNLQTSHFFLPTGTKMNHLQGIIPTKTAPLPWGLPFSPLDEVASPSHSASSQCTAPRHPAHIPRLQPACGVQGTALLNGSSPGGKRALTPETTRTTAATALRQVKRTSQI